MCFIAFVSNHLSLPSHLPSSALRVNFFFLFSYRARIKTDCMRCVFLPYLQTRSKALFSLSSKRRFFWILSSNEVCRNVSNFSANRGMRSEEHTSELQS